jgi:hypothetical protein
VPRLGRGFPVWDGSSIAMFRQDSRADITPSSDDLEKKIISLIRCGVVYIVGNRPRFVSYASFALVIALCAKLYTLNKCVCSAAKLVTSGILFRNPTPVCNAVSLSVWSCVTPPSRRHPPHPPPLLARSTTKSDPNLLGSLSPISRSACFTPLLTTLYYLR